MFVVLTGTLFCLQLLRQWLQQKGVFVCNKSFFFGTWDLGMLGLFSGSLLLILSVWLLWYAKTALERWGWVIIAVGGVSNLFERFQFGCVTDYLFLPFWPAFNVADALLCSGASLVLFALFLKKN